MLLYCFEHGRNMILTTDLFSNGKFEYVWEKDFHKVQNIQIHAFNFLNIQKYKTSKNVLIGTMYFKIPKSVYKSEFENLHIDSLFKK